MNSDDTITILSIPIGAAKTRASRERNGTKAQRKTTPRRIPALWLLQALRTILSEEEMAAMRSGNDPLLLGTEKRARNYGFVDALCSANCRHLLSDASAMKLIREVITDWIGQARAYGTPRESIEAWAFAHGVSEEEVGLNVAQWHAARESNRAAAAAHSFRPAEFTINEPEAQVAG